MMRQYELVERVLSYDPHADEGLLNKAYVYAMKAHGHQKRASGDPYFSHPLEVAAILTDLKLDDATIATALLHDTIEDTQTTRSEIDQRFGEEIGQLVDGLTKISKLDLVSKRAEQAENFRKLLVAIASDIRVLLVKLADRLHNMRTLQHVKPHKRQRIAEETMDIYAPLAGRMGMQWLREELEALSFRWLNQEAYDAVVTRLELLREESQGLIDEILEKLRAKFEAENIKVEIAGREKKAYSIWRKMERKQISLEQLSDIYGFRIIVEDIKSCYQVLGVVHTSWRTVPGRFKDYISNPKQNDYQSIHTTIIGPRHQRVELQIRTQQMHDVAEHGVAAHALYKDGIIVEPGAQNGAAQLQGAAPLQGKAQANGSASSNKRHAIPLTEKSNAYLWLRHLVDMLLEGDNPEEFLEHTKLELFQDQVFCFTPKGRLIALPQGATPIDFAYAVHTDVGNNCVGARVNGRQIPLISILHNGDEVEIITSKAQTPLPAWEKIAVTGKARASIRRANRAQFLKQYSGLGEVILQRAFEQIDEKYAAKEIEKVLHRFSQKSVDEVLAAVGRGELASADLMKALYPEKDVSDVERGKEEFKTIARDQEEGWFKFTKAIGLKFHLPKRAESGEQDEAQKPAQESHRPSGNHTAAIHGIEQDLSVQFANPAPIPGDRIVGILSKDQARQGVTIYPIDAKQLQQFENELDRWIDVIWDMDIVAQQRFAAQIEVTVLNEPGSLAKIAGIISGEESNIDDIVMLNRAPDFTRMRLGLEVWDLKHLNRIISALRALSVVSKIERTFHEI